MFSWKQLQALASSISLLMVVFGLTRLDFTRWQRCIINNSLRGRAFHNPSCAFSHVRSDFDLHQETHWSLSTSAGLLSTDICPIIKHYPSSQPKLPAVEWVQRLVCELLGRLPFRLPSSLHQFIMWWMSSCHNINPNAKSALSAQELRVGWRSDNNDKNCCVRMRRKSKQKFKHISEGQYLQPVIL